MNNIRDIYRLKCGVVEPYRYLETNIQRFQFEYGRIIWSITREDYVSNEIDSLEETLEKYGLDPLRVFGKKVGERTLSIIYRSKMDVSPMLNNKLHI